MVKIRLTRLGKRNRPMYRLVVMDSRSKRDGKLLDILGYYDPLREGEFKVDLERVDYWVKVGAQITDRAKALIKLAKKKTEVSVTN